MRVIISTQGHPTIVLRKSLWTNDADLEPTVVPPVLLDLCSVAILHRFSSPSWWNHLINHVPTDFSDSDAFEKIVKLQVSPSTTSCLLSIHSRFQTGQAIVLAPSGLGLFNLSNKDRGSAKDKEAVDEDEDKVLSCFGRRYIVMKTRRRVTADGGASLLVVESS